MFEYIGERFKELRTEVFNDSQDQFAKRINNRLMIKYGDTVPEKYLFNQVTISSLESKFKISKEKLILLIDYIHSTKRINPLWLLLLNNNSQKKFIQNIVIDKNISEKQELINQYMTNIDKEINDIDIIIKNMFSK